MPHPLPLGTRTLASCGGTERAGNDTTLPEVMRILGGAALEWVDLEENVLRFYDEERVILGTLLAIRVRVT